VRVHIYLDGGAGKNGKFFKSALANKHSANTVGLLCKTNLAKNRFSILLSSDEIKKHAGEKIFIHGISTTGKGSKNLLLKRSGEFRIPFADPQNVKLKASSVPNTKQGLSDRNYNLLSESRYKIFSNELNLGIQKYNMFWANFENSNQLSSLNEINCPSGYIQFPENEVERNKLGVKKYHCYKKNAYDSYKASFKVNLKHNIQLAVVLWTAPEKYRSPGCEGFDFSLQNRHLYLGCYPSPHHYDDYSDWIAFVASRFGKYIDHYIVWNEVDSMNWADVSSSQYSKSYLASHRSLAVKLMTNANNELMKRTITQVKKNDHYCNFKQNNSCSNLVYVSLTKNLNRDFINNPQSILIGGLTILDSIWRNLGLSYNWSVAFHPYGLNAVTNTTKSLASYQKENLILRGIHPRLTLAKHQSRILLSEQNHGNKNLDNKAEYICQSQHQSISQPEIIGQTHNHFQRTVTNDRLQNESEVLDLHSMLPVGAGRDLQNRKNYVTYQAYLSTSKRYWGKRDNHFCCKNYNLGCSSATNRLVKGRVDKRRDTFIRGWAYDQDIPFSSVVVYFYIGNKRIGKTIANKTRVDVNSAFSISGNHGFHFNIPRVYQNQYENIDVRVVDLTTNEWATL
jgi:hypothetical protein